MLKQRFKNPPLNPDRTLYDWDIRWRSLKIVSFRSNGWVDLVVGGRDTLVEMYEKGFLTGQAKIDTERIL